MRVLVVEDDAPLRDVIAKGLREQAYAVDAASDGDAALYLAAVNSYDAIVLDVLLPRRDGLSVARELRHRGINTPVLMLTARDTVADKIAGLDSGADDYLSKPFDFAELLARLRALLRRGPVVLASTITVADLEIDTRSQGVRRGGKPLSLTTKEYALLEFMARNAGTVLTREAICAHVWDDNHDPFSNAIEVYINRLRRKTEMYGGTRLIHTRRGAGYVLAADEEDGAAA